MLVLCLTTLVCVVVGITTMLRMYRNHSLPLLLFIVLPLAVAAPVASAWFALFPDPAVQEASLRGPKDSATLDLAPHQALLVTGILSDMLPDDARNPAFEQTRYVIKVKGDAGEETLSGSIKRRLPRSEGGVSPPSTDGTIQSQDTYVVSWFHEQLQDRFRVGITGPVEISLYNWQGKAAAAVDIQVLPSPVPRWAWWSAFGVLSALALLCDLRLRTDRLSIDVGFLTLAALFMDMALTPAGGLLDLLLTMGGGMILGGIGVGGMARILERSLGTPQDAA